MVLILVRKTRMVADAATALTQPSDFVVGYAIGNG
jgi:hypothetical protein